MYDNLVESLADQPSYDIGFTRKKKLYDEIKQMAIDNDTNMPAIVEKAFRFYMKNKTKKKSKK